LFVRDCIYEALRENLVERMSDKESCIRAQTVVALSRLSPIEDPSELEGEKSILELLTEVIIYDDEA
jgi:condensin complex subunit 3